MALTKSFKELVQRRVADDSEFADALLREGIDTMLTGDVETGKAILRDYIKATVGFEKLGAATDTPPKSSSACSARAATPKRAICSVSSDIYRNRRASNSTSRLARTDTGHACTLAETRAQISQFGEAVIMERLGSRRGAFSTAPARMSTAVTTARLRTEMPCL